MNTIGFIGAGEMGQALAAVFRQGGATVGHWDTDTNKCSLSTDCASVVRGSEVLFLCVPSWALREATEHIASLVAADTLVVTVAKGIEAGTRFTADQVLASVLGDNHPIALLYGPMLAEELEQGLPTVGVLATADQAHHARLQQGLANTNLTLEHLDDVHGVAVAGVLKNIYAIGLGIAHGLALGHNSRGWYVQQAQAEMAQLVAELGGHSHTAYSLAGIGDLITTGFSGYSKNFTLGQELGTSGTSALQSEGVVSLPHLITLRPSGTTLPPILAALSHILRDKQAPRQVFANLLAH